MVQHTRNEIFLLLVTWFGELSDDAQMDQDLQKFTSSEGIFTADDTLKG